jgi:serine protease Do
LSPSHSFTGVVRLGAFALLLGGCSPSGDSGTAHAAVATGSSTASMPAVQEPAIDAQPSSAQPQARPAVDESRRTAIVQASSRVAPAVVTVSVISTQRVQPTGFFDFFGPQLRRAAGFGSGFIIDGDGIVLTNEHVVRNAERIMVTLSDGRDYDAELVGLDEVVDVAVVRIEATDDDNFPVAPLGTSDGLIIGEWVVAIGNPFGTMVSNTEPTVTAGVVSALRRHIVPDPDAEGSHLGMIQTDAAINPGNSGGPLVNALGEVVGVNSSIFSRSGGSEGLGFAIPIDRALKTADDLLKFGEIRRPWLGITVEAVEADAWGRTRGVRVAGVAEGSPAAERGIAPGIRLLEASGRRLVTPLDFEDVVLDLRVGDEVVLQMEGAPRPVTLRAQMPPSAQAERAVALGGLELITVTPAVRVEKGLRSETGALVMSATPEMQSRLGLEPGDVVLRVNETDIRGADQLADLLEGLRGRRGGLQVTFERRGRLGQNQFLWNG